MTTKWALPNFYVGAAAAAKSLQSYLTLCDPRDGSHQAPPSLGFSRQEHWSGLPFPSPMHESEKWKWSCSVMSDSLRPHGLKPTRLLCPWDSPGKSTGVGCHRLLWGSSYVKTKTGLRIMGLSREKKSLSHLRDKMDKSQKSETQTLNRITTAV